MKRNLKFRLHFLAGRKLEHLSVVSVWSFRPNLVGTPKNIIFNVKVRPGVNPLKCKFSLKNDNPDTFSSNITI